jgi:hypothetical protein
MNSSLDRHLLEHLCSRYGAGKLPGGRSGATLAGESDRLGGVSLPAPMRIAVADIPAKDIVLDDPRDDSIAEIAVRGGLPEFGRS